MYSEETACRLPDWKALSLKSLAPKGLASGSSASGNDKTSAAIDPLERVTKGSVATTTARKDLVACFKAPSRAQKRL